MKTIHIKMTQDVPNELISDLMNLLIKNGYKTEKYLVPTGKVVMAKSTESTDKTSSKKEGDKGK